MRTRTRAAGALATVAFFLLSLPVHSQSLGDAANAEARRRARAAGSSSTSQAKPDQASAGATAKGSPGSSSTSSSPKATSGALGGASAPRTFSNDSLLELKDQKLSQGTYSVGVEGGPEAAAPAAAPEAAPAPTPPPTQAAPTTPQPAPAATSSGGRSASTPKNPQEKPASPAPTGQPIPELELARWNADMLSYGERHCSRYDDPNMTDDQKLGATFYDAVRVFYQIADHTGNAAWNACALKARSAYRDWYVVRHHGAVPGYWNFSTGLRMDWERTGDPVSKNAVIDLSRRAAYTPDVTPLQWTAGTIRSREVAYAIMSYLNAEAVGEPRRTRLASHVDQALGHIDQWFVSMSSRAPVPFPEVPSAAGQYYLQPFMVGLTLQALIHYSEVTADPRVLPAVKASVDALWERAWVARDESFWYQNWVADPKEPFPVQAGAPDLNLLIAPAFAWMYVQTGDPKYRDRGDQIFAGGVKRAWLAGSKQFNQNYVWSFDYVSWRSGGRPAPASR